MPAVRLSWSHDRKSHKKGSDLKKSKVSAQDVIAESKLRGCLAKQLYVVFTKPIGGMEAIMQNLADHLAFQDQLENDGIMFAAGPLWTDDGQHWEGEGMSVIRAESLAEAIEIAARDPMHIGGARTFRVRPWLVNEGTISIELGVATGRFKIV